MDGPLAVPRTYKKTLRSSGVYVNWESVSYQFSHLSFCKFEDFVEVVKPVKFTAFSDPEAKLDMVLRLKNIPVVTISKTERFPDEFLVELNLSYIGLKLKQLITYLENPDDETPPIGRGIFRENRFKFVQTVKELFQVCSEIRNKINNFKSVNSAFGVYDRCYFENSFSLKWQNLN